MIRLMLRLLRLLPFLVGGTRQLALENLALRQQLDVYKRTMARPPLRRTDRLFWVVLARVWTGWRRPLVIVTPNTVLRWQRRRFREYWTKLSARPPGGRPPVSAEIKDLVSRMVAANPLWGAPRIHAELLKLGIDVAERTVTRLMPKHRPRPSQTWRTFLTNHVRDLVSLDFFTVPTAGLRVLFVLVVLAHHRRRVVHFNVTEHPTAHWAAQQIVDAFPDDSAPAYLLRDRDAVYGDTFRQRVKGMGIGEVLTAPRSPWQNPSRSDSSARSGASVWTMSSFSASGTSDASSPRTSRTITGLALTCRSTKMHPTDGRSSRRRSTRSSRFPKLVACITATFGARRSSTPPVFHATGPRHWFRSSFWLSSVPPRISSRLATSTSGGRGLSGASYQFAIVFSLSDEKGRPSSEPDPVLAKDRPNRDDSIVDAFRQGLREHGYVEGQNLLIEWRFARSRSLSPFPPKLLSLPRKRRRQFRSFSRRSRIPGCNI